ncbi:MAG: prephenate dehydratase [Planctomycetaceae bacterium]|nr:prephenate dehydratase [Planctomycetaceae bacterium]
MAKKRPTLKKSANRAPKKAARKKPAKKTPARKKAPPKKTKSTRTAVRKKPAPKPEPKPRKKPQTVEQKLALLDKQILKLINERAQVTVSQIDQKTANDVDLFDNPLEHDLWEKLDRSNHGPLSSTALRSVYREILSAARAQIKRLRVAYLGPKFSFTHLAAIQRFGKSADLIPVNTIASVFEEVNRGHSEYGLVPIENSTDGRIVDTLDMFTRLPLRICGEVQMSVHHNLMSRSPRSEIVEIYSKPQALSQCRDWLARNMPLAHLHEVTSTSTAATLARDKPGAGAIASAQAAVEYGLDILAERIEDNAHNVTRFAVIGDRATKPTGKDRTALLLQISHKPGSLSEALAGFKRAKINLTWIESFPLRGPEVGYLFFLDFEGHMQDGPIKRALAELEQKAVRLEVLGSYPRSEPLE